MQIIYNVAKVFAKIIVRSILFFSFHTFDDEKVHNTVTPELVCH